MDSDAAREIFINNKNCLLVKPENAKELAMAIIKLKKNKVLSKKIAKEGHKLYKTRFNNMAIGKELVKVLKKVKK